MMFITSEGLPSVVTFGEYVERLGDSSQLGVDRPAGDVEDAAKTDSYGRTKME